MVQSLVIQGEASESDDELPRIQKDVKKTENDKEPTQRRSFLMQDLQEDVTNSLKWLIQDTQEAALEELRNCNQLLLSTQVVLQKDTSALQTAANNLENVSQKLDDILSFNFIPKIEFHKKTSVEALSDTELEMGVDTLTNEMIEML